MAADVLKGRTVVWASWNGSTEVAYWRVAGGPSRTTLKPLGVAPWRDLETRLEVAATPGVLQVQALDREGRVLGESEIVRPR